MSFKDTLSNVVFLALLLVLSVWLMFPKGRSGSESFADAVQLTDIDAVITNTMNLPTTMGLFKKGPTAVAEATITRDHSLMADRDSLFIAHRCYQFPPTYFWEILQSLHRRNIYTQRMTLNTNNSSELVSRISTAILGFQEKLPTRRISGEIYALVSQAPYYRDVSGKEMVLQYTIDDYLSMPVNVVRPGATTGVVSQDLAQPIFVRVILIYGSYDRRGAPLAAGTPAFNPTATFRSFETRDKLCFIQCPNPGKSEVFCGCATERRRFGSPYDSTCLGPRNPGATTPSDKVVQASFVLGYKINREYPVFVKNETFREY